MATVKAATQPKKTAADRVAETLASARAASAVARYSIPERARFGACADGTSVALGTLATGKLAGTEMLVHVNGTAQVGALPYHVVLTAISSGAIPAEIVRSLIGE